MDNKLKEYLEKNNIAHRVNGEIILVDINEVSEKNMEEINNLDK